LLRYSERLNMITSRTEMRRIADVPAHHLDEERVPLCGPDSGHVADRPEQGPAIHSRRPRPADTVPLRIATARGDRRAGSVR
jgi:hypothetical protein